MGVAVAAGVGQTVYGHGGPRDPLPGEGALCAQATAGAVTHGPCYEVRPAQKLVAEHRAVRRSCSLR